MNPETTNNFSQTNPTPTQVAGSPKKCKHMPIIVVLTILAVAGIGFGGFELWQNVQKDNQISDLETRIAGNNGNLSTTEVSGISLKQVRNILNKFVNFDYSVTSTENNIFGDKGLTEQYKYYLSLKKLNYSDKVSAVHKDGGAADYEYSFTYDDINNAYHSLFGSNSNVQNQESFWCFVPFFSTEYNKYISISRCGGVDPSIYAYEVLDYSTDSNKLTVEIAYIHISEDLNGEKYITLNNGNEKISYETLSPNYISENENNLPKYRLTFEKEDSNYILRGVSKL